MRGIWQAVSLAVLGLIVVVMAHTPLDEFAAAPLTLIGLGAVGWVIYLVVRSRRGG